MNKFEDEDFDFAEYERNIQKRRKRFAVGLIVLAVHLRVLVRCAIVSLLTMGTLGVAEPAGPSRGRAHRAARAVLPATYLFAFSSIESFQQGAKYIIFSARKMREF